MIRQLIFRQKTSPAFEVALQLGAAYAGAGTEIAGILSQYSLALGIAYQIQDDLDDLNNEAAPDDITALRPSMPLAIAYERARGEERTLLDAAWQREADVDTEQIRRHIVISGAETRSRELMESYKEQAIRSLVELENASLKGLLRRVIGKIFHVELKGWCREFETRNAPGSEAVASSAG